MTNTDTESPITSAADSDTASEQGAGGETTLNRAERRARAKGKSTTASAAKPTASRGVPAHGAAGRVSTTGAPTLFPRTGHK